MAQIDRFDAKAPRLGNLDVPTDDGSSAMLAQLAQSSAALANRLGAWADKVRVGEAQNDAAAHEATVEMPGVEFAYGGKSATTTAIKPTEATAPAGDNLAAHLTDPTRLPHLQGIRPEFRKSLAALISAAPENLRNDIKLLSGYRSPERQAQLFKSAVAKYGSEQAARKWVAPPGRSRHNHGDAFDLQYGSDAAKRWVHENAAAFGLSFPMAHEPWHIEPAGARANAATGPISTPGSSSSPTGAVTVKLTGQAGPLQLKPAGTIYGDAYNRAATDIHINRLDTAMRAQMEATALEHEGDPAGLSEALDALRAGYVRELPPQAATLVDQSFQAQKLSLTRQAITKFNDNLDSQALATLEENIAARTASIYRLAANGGTDEAANNAIASELGALDQQIEASRLTPLQKSRAKSDVAEKVMSARVLGGFEGQKDPAGRAAYAQKFQEDWRAGKLDRMDLATYDRINGEIMRGIQADQANAAKQTTAIDGAIKGQIAILKKGWPVTDQNRTTLKNQVAATGNPALANNLDFLDGLTDWQKAHIAARPEVIGAQIAAMQDKIQKEGATEAGLTTLDVMEGLREQMTKGLHDDPLTWANRAGVLNVEPLDFSNGATLSASLTERVADARAVSQHYGIQPKYFTPAEAEGLKKTLKSTPLALPSLASSLVAGFGDALPQAMGEISKDAPVLAQVANLVDATGSQKQAVEVASVLEQRAQPGYKSFLPPEAKLRGAAVELLGPALANAPGMAGAMGTAAALLEGRALERGIDLEHFDEAGNAGRALFQDALDEAVGATWRDGVKFGGSAEVNGAVTIAPPDIEADGLEDMIANISADDLLFQDGIGSMNGIPITPAQLHSAKLVMTARPGRYRLALGDIEGGAPRFVPDGSGGAFELDIGMLKRSQQSRGLQSEDSASLRRRKTIQNWASGTQ